MKATVSTGGVLYVYPQSDLEVYALSQWAKSNMALINGTCFFSSIVIKGHGEATTSLALDAMTD